MKNRSGTRLVNCLILLFVLLFLQEGSVSAQRVQVNKGHLPQSGQGGKDVIWVPTPQPLVEKMLDLANVHPGDFVLDLGSGDGRTVIAAAKRGARARGVEIDPNMIKLSRKNAEKEGVANKVEFIQGDLFEADLSQATVITLFLLPSINLRLRPALLALRPGTRIVSNTFRMGEWMPDKTVRGVEGCEPWCDALLWIVPAKVAGTWKIPQGLLKLVQNFQILSGYIQKGRNIEKISTGRLVGNQITFIINNASYSGVVKGNSMEGVVTKGRRTNKWNAVKVSD